VRTGAAILLGVGLIVAAGFGYFFAWLSLGDISHSQQGYSCREPPQNQECSALAAQLLFWQGVQVMSMIAFVAGLLLPILAWIFEKP